MKVASDAEHPPSPPSVRQRFERGLSRLSAAREHGAGKAQRLLGWASTRLTRNPMGGECGILDGLALNVDQMLLGYMQGLFPMDVGGKLRWRCPSPRFTLLLADLRVPADLERAMGLQQLEFTFDRSPREVVDACAREGDADWLSERLKQLYLELFELDVMHSLEVWQKGQLVGGSFGLSLGQVWTLEARFERAPHIADVQCAHLARQLSARGYSCMDGQVYSVIMARLGGHDMPVDVYRSLLARGFIAPVSFSEPAPSSA